MTYPMIQRTYFTSQKEAYSFAGMISKLQHHIVSGYGVDESHTDEPYFIETINDPFSTKDELLKRANII